MSNNGLNEFKVGEHTYQYGFWSPDDGLTRLVTLIKLVGEPIVKLIVGATSAAKNSEKGLDADVDEIQVLSTAMSGLAAQLNEQEVKNFIRGCQDQLLCDNKQINYDMHYKGRIGHLMQVTMQQLRGQYSDFLELLPVARGISSATGLGTQPPE